MVETISFNEIWAFDDLFLRMKNSNHSLEEFLFVDMLLIPLFNAFFMQTLDLVI